MSFGDIHRKMSTYENYNEVSKTYDDQRGATGSDVIAAMIQFYCKRPLKELHILDAGCGTGNYSLDLLKYGVGHVTLFDASSGMLDKAKTKLAEYIASGRVAGITEGKMPPLPYADNTFDAVMFNLVLHHLDPDSNNESYATAEQVLTEGRRVLKPSGVIIITTVLKECAERCIWFTQLNRELTARFCKIMPSLEQIASILETSGLKIEQKMNILGDELFKGYHNYEGPLDWTWRSCISYWTYATDEEIESVKERVLELKASGELERWCKEHDHVAYCGFVTLLICRS